MDCDADLGFDADLVFGADLDLELAFAFGGAQVFLRCLAEEVVSRILLNNAAPSRSYRRRNHECGATTLNMQLMREENVKTSGQCPMAQMSRLDAAPGGLLGIRIDGAEHGQYASSRRIQPRRCRTSVPPARQNLAGFTCKSWGKWRAIANHPYFLLHQLFDPRRWGYMDSSCER